MCWLFTNYNSACTSKHLQQSTNVEAIDKDFQCTSSTALYLSKLIVENDTTTYKKIIDTSDYGYSSEADSNSIRRDSILDQDSTWHGKNFETTKASREIELGPEGLRLIDIDVQCMSALIISNSDIDGTSEKIKINSNGYKDYGYNIDH